MARYCSHTGRLLTKYEEAKLNAKEKLSRSSRPEIIESYTHTEGNGLLNILNGAYVPGTTITKIRR